MKKILLLCMAMLMMSATMSHAAKTERQRILVLTENAGQHKPFSDAAISWMKKFAKGNDLEMTVINHTEPIDSAFLTRFKVFVQLDYPPYNWTDRAKAAFEQAMFNGTIGWVGLHHAALLGNFDGFPMWEWASDFLGGLEFRNYIAGLADGKVRVERSDHPIMKNVSKEFVLPKEEWYTFQQSPRHDGITVLANVDEASYAPASDVKMGDHPVVWINHRMKARNVYFLMGHHPELLQSADFTTMLGNAITWAAGEPNWFPRFRMLVYANEQVEEAHRQFAHDAIRFFQDMTIGDGLVVDVTTDANDLNDEKLRTYHLLVCLNDNPGHTTAQREAFRRYMERGGAWLGFHAAGYNDRSTNWPWYLEFLGGGVFHRNNWPPQSARLVVDDGAHPVTKAMPDSYMAPMNEWYQWKPSPRENEKVKVLVTLAPENYPLGFKDTVPDGDLPVVWTNTDFNMLYINMGHGPRTFVDPTQNYLIYNAVRWLMREQFK
ncbi:MAG: ThuA domain-containing protein [Bacteroides sp.]|nr:ThuA domain-containing protein [Bacteroides sp.]